MVFISGQDVTRAQSPVDCRARRGDVAGLFRRALVPTSRSSTSHRGTPGRRNKEELQRTAVDWQPLLSGKLFIQVGRGDLAVAAANDEHVSPLSHGATCGRQRGRNRGLFLSSQM